jgi:hypothetical protein
LWKTYKLLGGLNLPLDDVNLIDHLRLGDKHGKIKWELYIYLATDLVIHSLLYAGRVEKVRPVANLAGMGRLIFK